MKIVVIDGQGGNIGKMLVSELARLKQEGDCIVAIGTNANATLNMYKEGADECATGENPVRVACRDADVILGPIGIVIADSLMGEITPEIATEIGKSNAFKVLIPLNKCKNLIVGSDGLKLSELVKSAVKKAYELR